jgi:hypothetical protein
MQIIYTALAGSAGDPANLLARVELYARLYRQAIRSVTVGLDLDGDGAADARRPLGVLTMKRA